MEFHDTFRYSMPYQVLKLVQQAHANQEFNTDPHIRVSPKMRKKLIYPLNPTLAVINGATEYPVTEHEFIYDIADSGYVKDDLHVTISVNIDYCDTAKHIDVHYHDVLLYIICSPSRDAGLQITSVEHN